MQIATRSDLVALTDLVRSLRPDWDRWLVESVLHSHYLNVDLADLAVAAVRTAADPDTNTPKAIGWQSRHWRGLDTTPTLDTTRLTWCGVCGKREDQCAVRVGPDDHTFEPVERKPALR